MNTRTLRDLGQSLRHGNISSGLLPTTLRCMTRETVPALPTITGLSMQAIDCSKDELEETFDRIDKNRDRSIEIEEFATLMLEMDRYASPTEMRACFDAIDSDRDGSVTFEEFRAWYRVGS